MVKRSKPPEELDNQDHCLIHCYQELPSKVGKHTVLEYCDIGENSVVGDNCILSNVTLHLGSSVPDNTFMTTICVSVDGILGLFVTVVFGISDNVKKTATAEDLGKLVFYGVPLDQAMRLLDVVQVGMCYTVVLN